MHRIVHIAFSHFRYDTRVFVKECKGLALRGFDVHLIVNDGRGDEVRDGVSIIDTNVRGRLRHLGWHSFKACIRLKPDVVHFHEAMFLPLALLLRMFGYRVIYDVHEDYRVQFMNTRFPLPVRRIVSLNFAILEWLGGHLFSHIIAATPKIAKHFPGKKTSLIRNFPLLGGTKSRVSNPPTVFCYVGGISPIRGYFEMVAAVEKINRHERRATLALAGPFLFPLTGDEKRPDYVRSEGVLDRPQVQNVLSSSYAGLCVLHPKRNYVEALPVKLFEYMASGLPVIVSNFPILKEIVEGARCGICVDPLSVVEIAEAMEWMLNNPKEAQAMGERGASAVRKHYNWSTEFERLLRTYQKIGVSAAPVLDALSVEELQSQ